MANLGFEVCDGEDRLVLTYEPDDILYLAELIQYQKKRGALLPGPVHTEIFGRIVFYDSAQKRTKGATR